MSDARLACAASVVIPAHNAASTIGAQLDALARQTTQLPFEVIVIENGSNDDTAERAREWTDRLANLSVAAIGPAGASAARNEGARRATTDLLLFCDADDVVSPQWVGAMIEALGNAPAAAGPMGLTLLNDEHLIAANAGFPRDGLFPWRDFLRCARTANLGVRTDVFWDVGGFDESYAYGEDTAFVWTLQLRGHDIVEASDALVEYRLRADRTASVRQARRWAESEVLLHREFAVAGMPRRTIGEAARSWVYLGLRMLPALRTPQTRLEWRRGVAKNVGRLLGSIRHRHFYP